MFKYILIVAILLQVTFAADWCELENCKGAEHVDCKMANGKFSANCPDSAVMLNLENAQTAILNRMNTFRNKVAGGNLDELEPAARMGKLQWNVSLANLCRKNVKKCSTPPDLVYDDCRNTPDFDFVGQNLAYAKIPQGDTTTNLNVILALIDVWNKQCDKATAADIAQFPGVTGANGENIASCTQDIKGYADRVGCGALVWTEGTDKILQLCCNFNSANVLNWPIYDAGAAGSKCKAKDTTFKNLCSTAENFNVNEFWKDYE